MSEQYHPAGLFTVFWNQERLKHELYLMLDEEGIYIRDVKGREPMPVEAMT